MATCKVLYKTDHHHSYDSRDLIGIFTNKILFEKEITKIIRSDIWENHQGHVEKTEEEISWHIGFFLDKKQTQGLRNFEIVFEELETNKIL